MAQCRKRCAQEGKEERADGDCGKAEILEVR